MMVKKYILFTKNKKGDERILSIYLFIIYIIVSIGIVSGVVLFHGAGLDIRDAEAEILSEKVVDCLIWQGELQQQIFEDDFNLEEFCRIKLIDNSASYMGEEQALVRVELFNFTSCSEYEGKFECSELIRQIQIGREDFLSFCELEGDKIPQCSEQNLYVLNDDQQAIIKILTAVGKVEKNV